MLKETLKFTRKIKKSLLKKDDSVEIFRKIGQMGFFGATRNLKIHVAIIGRRIYLELHEIRRFEHFRKTTERRIKLEYNAELCEKIF